MNWKTVVAGLTGMIVGILGYYWLGQSPSVVQHDMQPTTPTNVALMFGNDVSINSLYAMKSLMPLAARRHFTQGDWTSLRRWIGKRGADGYGLTTYEVLTFADHRTIALWLTTPIGSQSNVWQIQQIDEGTNQQSPSPLSFVALKNP